MRRAVNFIRFHQVTNPELSLSYKHPELLTLWDFEKNDDIQPYQISATSTRLVWWKCPYGHSELRTVNSVRRAPYCTTGICKYIGRHIHNSLKDEFPEIAQEWDYDRNYPLRPENVKPRYRKKVNWICKRGHSYLASPDNRSGKSSGCRECYIIDSAGRKRKPYKKRKT